MEYINKIDLARQAKLLSGNTASFGGSLELGEKLKVEGEVTLTGLETITGNTTVLVIDELGKVNKTELVILNEPDLISNSETALATQKSIKIYIDNTISSLGMLQGGFDATSGVLPSDANTGKGDYWYVTVAGTIQGETFNVGDVLIANINNPSTTSIGDWIFLESNRDQATFEKLGLVILATNDEVAAGTITDKVVTPATLKNLLDNRIDTKYLRDLYLNLPTTVFDVSGSPAIPSASTISVNLKEQTQNTFFGAPETVNGTPIFRVLTESDIPLLNWNKISTGSTPTSLAGYGIIDTYTKLQSDASYIKNQTATAQSAGFNVSTKSKIDNISISRGSGTGNAGNTAVGRDVLVSNTSGSLNTGLGNFTLYYNTTGFYCTGLGGNSLMYNTTGGGNTAVGQWSLYYNTTGGGNTAVGLAAGTGSGTGTWVANERTTVDNDSTFIGSQASRDASVPQMTVLTNANAIGAFAKVGSSHSMVLGGTGNYAVRVGVGTVNPNSNSVLDLVSTTKGFLIPRMTETERLNISVTFLDYGLKVYQTNSGTFGEGEYIYESTGWKKIASGSIIDSYTKTESDGKYLTTLSGNTNFVAKFTGTNTLGSSLIYDSGTRVALGDSVGTNLSKVERSFNLLGTDAVMRIGRFTDSPTTQHPSVELISYSSNGSIRRHFWDYFVDENDGFGIRQRIRGGGLSNSGTVVDLRRFYIKESGQISFNFYTSADRFSGIPLGYLMFDSNGNIITKASPGYELTYSKTETDSKFLLLTGGTISGLLKVTNTPVNPTDVVRLQDLSGYTTTGGGSTGTVTSVGMTVPTGLSVTPATITTSGTFDVSLTTGYSIPSTTSQGNWDTAFASSHDKTKLWAVSHPDNYYIQNTWDGTYWQITSNHGSPVNVARATNAGYADTAGSAPASDVYAWAKAASKPSYSKSEVGLSDVDNTADSVKSVNYAASAGSAGSAGNADTVDNYHASAFILNGGSGDWSISSSDNSSYSYSSSTLELREALGGGTGSYLAPRLGFHWGGVVASQLVINLNGAIMVRNASGLDYEDFIARNATFNGYVTATGGAGTSDIRYKTIKPFNFDLKRLDNLPIYQFEWNDKMGFDDEGRQHYGWMAQEVQEINPNLIMGTEEKLSLNKEELLILEVKRLKERLLEMDERLKRLENK